MSKLLTRRNQSQPRVYYLLTLGSGQGGSRPIKSSLVKKMVSDNTAGSDKGTPAASNEKPVWMHNLTPKGSPLKAQAAIMKEMDAIRKGGIFKPLKKAVKAGRDPGEWRGAARQTGPL